MTKSENWPYVINMGNSIIGVTVLAMPFCFRTCGMLVGIVLLTVSSILTYTSCSLLVKTASQSRRHTYEYLALHTFGAPGKLVVEISIIGLLIGTCVAFYVIIGDLGPSIISRALSIELLQLYVAPAPLTLSPRPPQNTPYLRTILMVVLALCVALPLGMLRDLESLSRISAVSLSFYFIFVLEVIIAAIPNLLSGVWLSKVEFWNPDGIFKCLPIFSLAFSCQTQLFLMYQDLPDPTLKRMSEITKSAIFLCFLIYLMVGFFGYVAFCDEDISGDVLMNFRPTFFSELIKFCFVISVATSFPLVIFPCRAAINTLCYSQDSDHSHSGPIKIPPMRFKLITGLIVICTLFIGIKVPNIEFVLALTGATMGSVISFIIPAIMFINVMSISHSKKSAQCVLFLGVTILIASTYVTLNSADNPSPVDPGIGQLMKHLPKDGGLMLDSLRDKKESVIKVAPKDEEKKIKEPPKKRNKKNELNAENNNKQIKENLLKKSSTTNDNIHLGRNNKAERHEPANPLAPNNDQKNIESPKIVKPDNKIVTQTNRELLVKEDAKQFLKEMKENQQQQKKMLEQQKEILKEIKLHRQEVHKEIKRSDHNGQSKESPNVAHKEDIHQVPQLRKDAIQVKNVIKDNKKIVDNNQSKNQNNNEGNIENKENKENHDQNVIKHKQDKNENQINQDQNVINNIVLKKDNQDENIQEQNVINNQAKKENKIIQEQNMIDNEGPKKNKLEQIKDKDNQDQNIIKENPKKINKDNEEKYLEKKVVNKDSIMKSKGLNIAKRDIAKSNEARADKSNKEEPNSHKIETQVDHGIVEKRSIDMKLENRDHSKKENSKKLDQKKKIKYFNISSTNYKKIPLKDIDQNDNHNLLKMKGKDNNNVIADHEIDQKNDEI